MPFLNGNSMINSEILMNLRTGICTFLVLLCCCPVAQAATFCATSGNELNIALNDAEFNGEDDIVKIATGTHTTDYHAPGAYQWQYSPPFAFAYGESIDISGGWNGADNCQTQITKDPAQTVLDARYWGPVWGTAFNLEPFTGTLKISNLTLARGQSEAGFNAAGMLMLSQGGNITVDNMLVTGNRSGAADANVAFFQMYAPGTMKVRNSQFLNNDLTHANSGGVYFWMNGGAVGQFTNNSISLNSVTAANMGLDSLGVATLTNNAVGGNTSTANPNYEFISGAPTELTLVNNHFETTGFFNGSPFSDVNTTNGDPAWSLAGFRMVPDAVSPLRDSGENAPLGQIPNIDFSGNPRIANLVIDRGAVEAEAPPVLPLGPLVTPVSPTDGSITVLYGNPGEFVGTQLTFDVSGGVAPGTTKLECAVTQGAPDFGMGSTGETVAVGGSITPIDVGFTLANEVLTGQVTCEISRDLSGISTVVFDFVGAPPGGPAVIATSPQPAPDPSSVIDLTPAIAAVAGSDVFPKTAKIFNVADYGSSDLLIGCSVQPGSDPEIQITPSLVVGHPIEPKGAFEVSLDCDTSVPGSYSANWGCAYDLDDTTNPVGVDGSVNFSTVCEVRPPPTGPVYGSSPSAEDDMDIGSVIQNGPDPFLDLQITNYGAADSTLSGSCSITAGGGTFSIDGDNAFSLAQNTSDTVRVICDSAQAIQQHIGELQCTHDGESPGEENPAVYQLDCGILAPPVSDVIPNPPGGTAFETVLDPGGTFAFDVAFPEVKNEGVDASLVGCSLDDGSVFAITSPASFPQVIASGTTVTVSVEGTAPDGASSITDTLRCTYTDSDSNNVEVVYPINVILQGAARFGVTKDFTDGNPGEVTVRLDCNTGLVLDQDKVISPEDGDPAVVFVVTDFDSGELNCTVTEDVAPGYEASYSASGDSTSSNDDGCVFTAVAAGDENGCLVTNSPALVDVVINKEWVIEGAGGAGLDTGYQLTLHCDSLIEGGYSCENPGNFDSPQGAGGSGACKDFHGTGSETFVGRVMPDYPESHCWVEEQVYEDAIEIDNGCIDIVVSAGNGDECTITNTVFFEGIPSLNPYGLAILALLMLGIGFVAVRRVM
jgi:hypothetical protein